ncbi:MAG: SH3 domain-containing protein [Pseudomonadota bacterium]
MVTFAAGPRGLLTLSLALLLLGLASGCATVSTELEKGYHALAQEEYYVKRQGKLWARPDRSSSERGYALKGEKVVKLEGDVRGWSKVKVEGRDVEGWLPAAYLSKSPVSQAQSTPAAAPAAAAPAAAAPTAAAPAPAKSDSILSPSSAEAAETPPLQGETKPKRHVDPKKFEPL